MDNDYKLFVWLIVLIITIPLLGMAVETYQKNNCRVELAKAGRSVEDITALCK